MICKRRRCGGGFLCVWFAAVLLLSGCGPGPAANPPAPDRPPPPPAALQVWESDPALSGHLGLYETVGDFQMRWPLGFQPMKYDGPLPPGHSVYVRQGTVRPNGGRPRLFIVTTKSSPDRRDETLKELLTARLQTEKTFAHNGDWQETAPEAGVVNGIPALKVHWEGSLSWALGKTCGEMYACASPGGSLMIAVTCDAEPYCRETLKLLAAAALSVHSDEVRVAISDHLANWQPDPLFAGELDDYEEVSESYEMRGPSGSRSPTSTAIGRRA